jgi:hypothetical protein
VYRAGRLDGDVVEYDEAGHAAFRTRFVADRQVGERVAAADASAGRAPWYRRLLG